MSAKVYLISCLMLIGLDAWVGTYFWVFLGSMAFNPVYLVLLVVLDLVFIFTNLDKLALRKFEVFILWVFLFHLILGVLVLPNYSDEYTSFRALRDAVLPMIFIAKCVIFRHIFSLQSINNHARVLVRGCLIIVGIQILILLLKPASDIAIGFNPPINLLLGVFFSGGPIGYLLVSIFVLLLAGKRSIFLSLLVAGFFAIRKFWHKFFFASLFFCSWLVLSSFSNLDSMPLLDKISISYYAISDIDFMEVDADTRETALYIATAGRSEEVISIFKFMEPINWIFGVGAGFSYEFRHPELGLISIANSHFTPLSISYKFGLFIGLYFLYFVSKDLIWGLQNKRYFLTSVSILFLIQSFFSFNIFVEVLYPLILSWLSINRENDSP